LGAKLARSFWLFFLTGLAALAGAGWLVIGPQPPTTPNLALFLVLLAVAIAGLLAPLLGWLHRRIPFGGWPPAPATALRQGFLLGLGLALVAWLRLNDLLDMTLALGAFALVILAEILIQSREK